jgi:hypothetical protein
MHARAQITTTRGSAAGRWARPSRGADGTPGSAAADACSADDAARVRRARAICATEALRLVRAGAVLLRRRRVAR